MSGGLMRARGRNLVGRTVAQQGVALVAVARELEPPWQEGVPKISGNVEHDRLGPLDEGTVAVDSGSRVGLGAAEGAGFREAEFQDAVPEAFHEGIFEAFSDPFEGGLGRRRVGAVVAAGPDVETL